MTSDRSPMTRIYGLYGTAEADADWGDPLPLNLAVYLNGRLVRNTRAVGSGEQGFVVAPNRSQRARQPGEASVYDPVCSFGRVALYLYDGGEPPTEEPPTS